MPQTCTSASTPYCTGLQLVGFYDVRTIGQLLSDNDVPIPDATVPTYPLLTTLLMSGAGRLESVAMMGGRYKAEDLQALTGNAAVLCAELNAAITMQLLLRRRPEIAVAPLPQMEEAQAWLQALEDGKTIFPTLETVAAGVLSDHIETPIEVEERQMVTLTAERMLGRRNNRIWRFPGF